MISTLLELQRLKRLDRTGWTLRGLAPGAESVASHSYGVAVAAMLLADEVRARGVAVDIERLLQIALLHDWAEARTGDLPRAAAHYYGLEARRAAANQAFDDIIHPLGERDRYRVLLQEYEERVSTEAKLVKAADVIDLLLQALAFERAGARGLDEFWDGAAATDFQLDGAAGEVVSEILQKLVRARRSEAL